jgi:hypothetical protein
MVHSLPNSHQSLSFHYLRHKKRKSSNDSTSIVALSLHMVEIGIGLPLFLVYQIIPLVVSNFYGEGLYELHGKFC